jgi:hypothetical protein
MKGFLVLFIALLALVAHSCKELPTQTEPPVALALSLIDSTCTDLELKLSAQPRAQRIVVERLAQPQPVIIFDAVLNTPDTMILDTGLLPNTTYTYRAYRLANNTKRDISRALHARTMDTTSHDWAWTMQTFGVASSQLDDVAIVNDTLAYAVGKIYLNDSLGQLDYTPYNLAIWNGQRWAFKKIFYSGNLIITSIRGIYVSKPNEIWLAGGSLFRWDGQSSHAPLVFSRLTLPSPNATVEKLWGNSPSNVYGVGNAGTILHYNGLEWRRVESGTSLDIYDVYGDGEEVLAVAADAFSGIQGSKLIRLNGDQPATLLSPQSLSTATLNGLWFMSNRRYLGVGSRNFEKRRRDGQEWEAVSVSSLGNNWTMRVTGQAINDLFITATSSQILHFNGVSWRNFQNHLPDGEKWFRGIKVKHNLVIAVGIDVSSPSTRAVVAIGRRN